MNCNTLLIGFLSDFLANLLSDLIAGVLLGTVLALWIGRKLSKSEQTEQQKYEKREEIEKSIRYLTILNDDISKTYPQIEIWVNALRNSSEGYEPITSEDIPRIEYRFWDVVQCSGDVPKMLDPNILYTLTLYYGALTDARQSMDWAVEGWKIGESHSAAMARIRKFARFVLEALERALHEGNGLIERIRVEIKRLEDVKRTYEPDYHI